MVNAAAATVFAVTLLTALQVASGARILGVFLHHGYSHHMVFLPYLRALADRGHDVSVVSNFESSHPNITDISVLGSMPMHNNNVTFPNGRSFGVSGTWTDMVQLYGMATTTESAFGAPGVVRLLSDPDAAFDLIIAEHFNSELPLGFALKYRAPFVLLSSCPMLPYTMSLIGQPQQTSYRPSTFSGLSSRMDFGQRLTNTVIAYLSVSLFRVIHRPWSQSVIGKHLGVDASLNDFASNVSLVLVNTHWTISGASPTLPAVLEVGGIHIKPSRPLPAVSIPDKHLEN